MKNFLAFNVLIATSILLSSLPSPTEASLRKNKSFEQWCLQKNALPNETKKTIEVLLKKADTQDCKLAEAKLNRPSSVLYLEYNQISDIKPLAGLTNLTELYLSINEITDIRPLEGLTNLTKLYLSINEITDIRPLEGLTNLTKLSLARNKVSDIKPLAGLTKLIVLYLGDNQI
ncbi:MAG: leucine-rich repeat domain-containing protein, partial [Pseudanabaena sp.]